jgi:sulfatase modifying factor 1
MSRVSCKQLVLVALACLPFGSSASGGPIQWVTVGDPGNAADTSPSGYGAVATSFQIMKYEFTTQQYADFLNSKAATDAYSLYNASMGSNARGGITRSGVSGAYTYSVKNNMGDKPVNFVSWWDAARVANWYHNGATNSSSTETGAYTLSGAVSGSAVAVNEGATFYIPTENQWYKASYYKGGSTIAGYWDYATQSDTEPTPVTADSTGVGSAGGSGNFANFDSAAFWNGQVGNVTTVGTNGGASAYGAFDMGGNLYEWNDLTGASNAARGVRGGDWGNGVTSIDLASSERRIGDPSIEHNFIGFRLAAPVVVPEPSTYAMALAGLACGGWQMWRRRRLRHTSNG